MGILSDFVTNLQYYYLAYKKKKKLSDLFNIHTCDCEDCEGCNCEDGCISVEIDSTEDINRTINRIKWLICDDCYMSDEDEYDEDCSD